MSDVQYNAADQLTQMRYPVTSDGTYGRWTEARSYNSLQQMTQLTLSPEGAGAVVNLQYVFPNGSNAGKITQQRDLMTGEDIAYTYDALGRQTHAEAQTWGSDYSYDGFGNLLA